MTDVKRKTAKMEILTLLLILINILKINAQDSGEIYRQTSFNTLPYVHVENMGNIRYEWGKFNVLSWIDLSEFGKEEEIIRSSLKQVEDACNALEPCSARNLIQRLKYQLDECSQNKFKVYSSLGISERKKEESPRVNDIANNKRNKRAIFGFVGDLCKVFFGTLTEDDAKKYDKQLSNIRKDIGTLASAVEDQTTAIQMTLGKIENVTKQFNENFQKLDKRIHGLDIKIENLTIELTQIKRNGLITEACVEIDAAITELDKKINIILESIVLKKDKVVNPKLLSPKTLTAGIKTLSQVIGQNNMPIPIHDDNYFEFLEVSDVALAVFNYTLAYIVKIPILQPEPYTAFKFLPVPKYLNNGALIYIDTTYPYVIANQDRTILTPIQAEYINHCKHYNNTYICQHGGEDIAAKEPTECLKTILQSPGMLEGQFCEYKVVNATNPLWIGLQSGNEWIYATKDEERMIIQCPEDLKRPVIKGTQKLWVKPGCIASVGKLKLYSYFELSLSKLQVNFTEEQIKFHFNENFTFLENFNKNISIPDLPKLELRDVDVGDLTNIGLKLSEVKKKVEEVKNNINNGEVIAIWDSLSWWKIALIAAGGLLLICIIFSIFCCRRGTSLIQMVIPK